MLSACGRRLRQSLIATRDGAARGGGERERTYTSVATMHSTPTNAELTSAKLPSQISTSSCSQRTCVLCHSTFFSSGSEAGVFVILAAHWRSALHISSPAILRGCSKPWWSSPRMWVSSVDVVRPSGRTSGGGGARHRAGLQRQDSSSPSPHPTSSTCLQNVRRSVLDGQICRKRKMNASRRTSVMFSRRMISRTHPRLWRYSAGWKVTGSSCTGLAVLDIVEEP